MLWQRITWWCSRCYTWNIIPGTSVQLENSLSIPICSLSNICKSALSMDCVGNNSIIKPHIKLPHIVRHGAHDQFSRLSPIFFAGEEPVTRLYNTTLSFSYTKHNIVVHLPSISSSNACLPVSWGHPGYSHSTLQRLCCAVEYWTPVESMGCCVSHMISTPLQGVQLGGGSIVGSEFTIYVYTEIITSIQRSKRIKTTSLSVRGDDACSLFRPLTYP